MYTERSITCYTFPVLCIYISIFIMKSLAYVSIYITLHILRERFFFLKKKLTLRMFFSYEEILRSYFMINPFAAHPFLLYMTFAQNELLA